MKKHFLSALAVFVLTSTPIFNTVQLFAQTGIKAAVLTDANDPGVVRVRQGLLKGVVQDGVLVLRGVPFAAPPVGPLRFRPPQPAAKWKGLRDATSNGPAAIQPDTVLAKSTDEYLGAKRSEDSLYLNIWAPVGAGPHPVFVWVHGGANEFGSATEPQFDGASFARRGVICVNVSYRVGILGFLELGEILGPGYRGSSANALKDIVAALGWVRDNIRAVGGDPSRVTVGGESAGGRNVTSLLAAPSARGLFQSAIIESGGQAIHTLKAAQSNARIVAESIKAKGGKPRDILTLPPDAIVELQTELGKRFNRPSYNRAVVDGKFLPEAPFDAIAKGSAKNIRLLIGTNRDEMAIFTNAAAAAKPLAQSEMTHMELADAEPIYQKYAATYPDLSPLALRIRFLTAEEYWLTCMQVAQAHQRTAAKNTWVYRFDRAATSGPLAGWVAHGAELPFVWNYLAEPIYGQILGPKNAIDQKIADEMHGRWVKFIFGDAPDVPGAPAWPRFDDQEQILIIDENTKLAALDKAEFDLWPANQQIVEKTKGSVVKPITGKDWTLTSLNGKDVAAGNRPNIKFEDGRVSGFGGINRLSGTYTLEGNTITFGAMVSTRMAGDPALMEQENSFAKSLAAVDGFQVSGNELTLSSKGTVVARFRSAP